MSPKVLRRCTLCGKFHASYLVNDLPIPGGKGYLCYTCWMARHGETGKGEKESAAAAHKKSPEHQKNS